MFTFLIESGSDFSLFDEASGETDEKKVVLFRSQEIHLYPFNLA